ncbi:Transcriptional regulator [Fulvimarina pelagi HTCC2506]|uniref:Transcriptional regulator n=2 Tax=Fulvimarina pelagi TaxID=217511 RepID=Q0G082_9HYPH|nr:MarR family transcriptional regulator [Fulvimarina pelagi]EAU40711.1 Transcriptional regulator [Fulvimarina pelagi HTCC2506]BAT31254.1 transcriptional regulator [Fulvimarina pelagi]
MHSQGFAARLFPAQWAALRYIHTAPEHLRTAIDLARFQGLASGAVARTVRTLIRKGFIEKKGTIGRGRAEQLELTERGRALLKKDPMKTIETAIGELDANQREGLSAGLRILVNAIGGEEMIGTVAGENEADDPRDDVS